jgi:hypothetical protein
MQASTERPQLLFLPAQQSYILYSPVLATINYWASF